MKTIVMRDENFALVKQALQRAVEANQFHLQFLTERKAETHADQVQAEIEYSKQLESAVEEFINGPGSWRRQPADAPTR